MSDVEGGADHVGRRKFYGRRHGKSLRPRQRRLIVGLLPDLAIAGIEPSQNPERKLIDPAGLFDAPRPVWLEIGTGGGEHIAHQAAQNPDTGLIGCEPFVNGVAMLLGRIDSEGLKNIRIHPGDARDLMDVLPQASIARVFVLYPDPWPKRRHADRRFMNPDNLRALARVMAPGAELRLATDIPPYVAHALKAAAQVVEFRLVTALADQHEPWPDWMPTRYEAKALREGRKPHYLSFLRA
jgi:tRNA (guanine-N7-)-methyltransferase